jgi:hypothetical protein
MQERDKLLSAACFRQVGELLFITLRASGLVGTRERG